MRAYRDALIRHRTGDPRPEHRRRRAGSALKRGETENRGRRALDHVPIDQADTCRASRGSRVATCRRHWWCRPSLRAGIARRTEPEPDGRGSGGNAEHSRRASAAAGARARTAAELAQAVGRPGRRDSALGQPGVLEFARRPALQPDHDDTSRSRSATRSSRRARTRFRNRRRPRFAARPSGPNSSGITRWVRRGFPTSRPRFNFQQWPGRDVESVPARARPGLALPAGRSECDADDRGPGRRPG